MATRERPFIIPLTDIDSREEAFRRAIQSVDPDGSKYPVITRCLHEGLEKEDPKAVLEEARTMREEIPNMKFTLERGGVVYEQVLVELPSPRLNYLPTRQLFSRWEIHRIESTHWPPIPIQDRVNLYLDKLIRTGEKLVS